MLDSRHAEKAHCRCSIAQTGAEGCDDTGFDERVVPRVDGGLGRWR